MAENGMCSAIEKVLLNVSKLIFIRYPAKQRFPSLSACLKIRGSFCLQPFHHLISHHPHSGTFLIN